MLEGVPAGHHERGFEGSDSVTSDGTLGLIKSPSGSFRRAFASAFGATAGNIRARLPEKKRPRRFLATRERSDTPSHEGGEAQAAALIKRFDEVYPTVVRSFAEDLEGLASPPQGTGAPPDQRDGDQPAGQELP